MSDFDEDVEAKLADLWRTGNEASLGQPLAELFAAKVRLATESVRVVCIANDIHPYGEMFLERLDQLTEGEVSLSCYWNDYIPAPSERNHWGPNFLPDLAPITHQFHDEKGIQVDHIVVFSTDIEEGATVAENLLRTREIVDAGMATVVALTATQDDLISLMEQIQARDNEFELPNILLGLSDGHRMSLAFRSLARSSNDEPPYGETDIPQFVVEKMEAKTARRLGL
ncbi:hypothetical protein GGQ73_003628 [Rhizobium skierniewicense]|uniref:Uncharacterized protein n=1 Tax=Rhizobium skierniewicense TaxID=984260 RepID=A0A7W6G3A4_9HYPH|nr:hypothetical protein [Rhizobium skierniewicense]MBB3947660.1 hypothetical protein [Rhizobium skierniewicense]